ncbi:MAG: TetR family transcriptional regulator [Nocardioidaceae bacterium]
MTEEVSPRKGDRTKAAILASARNAFHELGFDGASVRTIAAQANIDPAMVIRYFGSKQELFAAAVRIELRLPDLAQVPKSRRGRTLVEHFLHRWEGEPNEDALIMLLRSAVSHEDSARRLHTVFASQVVGALRPVVAASEVKRRSALVASQMLGLALTRYVLRLPAVADLSRTDVIRDFSPTIQRYVAGPLPH